MSYRDLVGRARPLEPERDRVRVQGDDNGAVDTGWTEHAGGERFGRCVGKYSITLKTRGLSLMRGSREIRHLSLNTGTMLAMMIEREATSLLPVLEVSMV